MGDAHWGVLALGSGLPWPGTTNGDRGSGVLEFNMICYTILLVRPRAGSGPLVRYSRSVSQLVNVLLVLGVDEAVPHVG